MPSGIFYMPRQTRESQDENVLLQNLDSVQETPVVTKEPVAERIVNDWNTLITKINFTGSADKNTKDTVVQAIVLELIRSGHYHV